MLVYSKQFPPVPVSRLKKIAPSQMLHILATFISLYKASKHSPWYRWRRWQRLAVWYPKAACKHGFCGCGCRRSPSHHHHHQSDDDFCFSPTHTHSFSDNRAETIISYIKKIGVILQKIKAF